MFSFSYWTSIEVHVLLATAFGITEFVKSGSVASANERCVNVSDETICYFKGSEKPLIWEQALQRCNSLNATLVVIRSRNEQDALADYLASTLGSTTSAWTAGRNITYRNWSWITGEHLNHAGYASQTKNHESPKDYAALTADLKFTTLSAHEELPYICQYYDISCKFSSDREITNSCLRFINTNTTWYDARNQCLVMGEDLAIINAEDHKLLKDQKLQLNQSYWIGLRKKSWRWKLKYDEELNVEIKYTNWDDNIFSTDGECISIVTSDGKWKAIACAAEPREVICQKGQGIAYTTISITGHSTGSHDQFQTPTESFTSASKENPVSDSPSPTEGSFLFYAAVVAGLVGLIIVCIIVIIVFLMRTRKRPAKYVGHQNNVSTQHNRKITNSTGPVNKPENVPVLRSDDMQGVYAEVSLSTLNQLGGGEQSEQPGILYAALEFEKEPTYSEPNQKLTQMTTPTKTGPLGDVYMPCQVQELMQIPRQRTHQVLPLLIQSW